MAQKKCSHCAMLIPKEASICPYCRKRLGWTTGAKVGLGVIIFLVFLAWIGSFNSSQNTPSSTTKTQEEIRKEQIEKHFSAWDGSHRGLTELIKKSMNDPKSYEHVETRYADKGDHLIVMTTFRGKNAFGGVVKNSVTAKVDLNGNVIEVISQGQ